jgi:hypothetical protein
MLDCNKYIYQPKSKHDSGLQSPRNDISAFFKKKAARLRIEPPTFPFWTFQIGKRKKKKSCLSQGFFEQL